MKKKTTLVISSIIISIVAFTACSKLLPSMINPENGLCGPVGLSNAQSGLFAQGNDRFFRCTHCGVMHVNKISRPVLMNIQASFFGKILCFPHHSNA
jgi:hypothetical protein